MGRESKSDNAAEIRRRAASFIGKGPPDVFQQNEKVHGIRGRRQEIEFFIKPSRLLIFRVDGKCANAGNIGCLKRPLHCVF